MYALCPSADLPEAYVFTAGYDVLRDEGIMYANKLKDHGTKVTWVNKATAAHGCWTFELPQGDAHRQETCDFVRNKLNI